MFIDTKETSFLHDLSKPSLEALSHVLRHREMWPERFVWEYRTCETCAMGLAGRLWGMVVHVNPTASCRSTAAYFEMPIVDVHDIFRGCGSWVPREFGMARLDAVTPDMVADQIDKYLASRVG